MNNNHDIIKEYESSLENNKQLLDDIKIEFNNDIDYIFKNRMSIRQKINKLQVFTNSIPGKISRASDDNIVEDYRSTLNHIIKDKLIKMIESYIDISDKPITYNMSSNKLDILLKIDDYETIHILRLDFETDSIYPKNIFAGNQKNYELFDLNKLTEEKESRIIELELLRNETIEMYEVWGNNRDVLKVAKNQIIKHGKAPSVKDIYYIWKNIKKINKEDVKQKIDWYNNEIERCQKHIDYTKQRHEIELYRNSFLDTIITPTLINTMGFTIGEPEHYY